MATKSTASRVDPAPPFIEAVKRVHAATAARDAAVRALSEANKALSIALSAEQIARNTLTGAGVDA